ncbi:MAG: hypothetical protein N3I86_07855 [Verrucomicrobiae bacterium]|nr:hypothetical protein [Verrucomicrobiae bacterium]
MRVAFREEPEHACEPALGSEDGRWIFESIAAALERGSLGRAA